MIPYFIILGMIIINVFVQKKHYKINFIIFLLFSLFYIIRNKVGTDWFSYELYFKNIKNEYIVNKYGFEILYKYLNMVFAWFFSSYRWMVASIGIFNCILFWKATKKYTEEMGLVLLLSVFYLFYPTIEVIRQSITIFLFYYSLQFLKENKSMKYLLINIIGTCFHISGVFAIIFYVVHKFKWGKTIFAVSIFSVYIFLDKVELILQKIPKLYNKYYWYVYVEDQKVESLSIKLIEYLVIILVLLFFYKKSKEDEWYKIIIDLLFMGLIIQIKIGSIISIIYRMTYFSDLGVIFGYIFFVSKMTNKNQIFIFKIIMCIYIIIRFYRVFPFENENFIYNIF